MSNLFSIFARFNSKDPVYSTLDTARQASNLTSVEVLSLLHRGFFDSRKSKRRKEGMERVIKRAKLRESRN